MQYQGRRLLVVFAFTLLVLVAGGRPTFAERPDAQTQEISQGHPDFQTQEVSQGSPDFQTQEEKAKAKDAKGSVSTQGYDWSED